MSTMSTTETTPLTITDAKVPAIVARAMRDAMLHGDRVVTFGPLTVTCDAAGLGVWACTSSLGHASLYDVPTASAIAWLHHHARGSRVAY